VGWSYQLRGGRLPPLAQLGDSLSPSPPLWKALADGIGVFTPTTRRNCRQLLRIRVHTADADATKQFRPVGIGGVYWALHNVRVHCEHRWLLITYSQIWLIGETLSIFFLYIQLLNWSLSSHLEFTMNDLCNINNSQNIEIEVCLLCFYRPIHSVSKNSGPLWYVHITPTNLHKYRPK